MEEDNALEDAGRIDTMLSVMGGNEDNLISSKNPFNIDKNNDNTAPPSGVSLLSRSSTFPV